MVLPVPRYSLPVVSSLRLNHEKSEDPEKIMARHLRTSVNESKLESHTDISLLIESENSSSENGG